MSGETTLKCSVCRRTFTGTSRYLRETIWPHAETHKRRASFSSTFVLSCNCGECDFCHSKAAMSPRKER